MLKRDSRLFVRSLLHVLIVGCILLFGCAIAVFFALNNAKDNKVMTVALVNEDTDSTAADMVLNLIATNENISSAVDVKFADSEEEAVNMVMNGAAAALIIPEDFFASVYQGSNYPCKIVLNTANTSLAQIIQNIADLGTDMLSSAQYCIYEGDLYLQDNGADDATRSAYNMYINTAVVSEAAESPEKYLTDVNIGYTTLGISFKAHYICAYLIFFFGLLSICFFHLYRDDFHKEKLLRLFSAGISKKRYMMWKIILPSLLYAVLMIPVLIIASGFVSISITPVSVISTIAALVFTAAMGALFTTSFLESAGAFTFVVYFVSLFFIGGIIPYSNLSSVALAIGNFTPLGCAYNMIAVMFGAAPDPVFFITALLYVAVGIVLSNRNFNRMVLGKEIA